MSQASRLSLLKSRLTGLRRRRAAMRLGTAWSALLTALLAVLAVVFLIDWTFELSVSQRIVLLLAAAGVLAWAFRRYTQPFLGWSESEVDVALMVERQQAIDSDLVAALQFEKPEARDWGSLQLERAVVDRVAESSPGLNVYEGLDDERFRRRTKILAGAVVVAVAFGLLFPAHAAAFFDRLLLGPTHYPTRTLIEEITVNGQPLHPQPSGTLRSPYGQPLRFHVTASGELPAEGTVRLRGLESGVQTEIALQPSSGIDAEADEDDTGPRSYTAELPRMVDSVACQVFLGDAWTDPVEITTIPLPAVEVKLNVVPPPYAAVDDEEESSRLQHAVIEGSRVEVDVLCANKRLQSATLTANDVEYDLSPVDDARRRWTLDVTDTPFADVREAVTWEVRVEDEDGLGLERPVQGFVRIKADRAPRVSATITYGLPIAVPNATRTIRYRVSDDYGIARLRRKLEIIRRNGDSDSSVEVVHAFEPSDQPVRRVEDVFPLEFAPLELVPGDQLKITFEATDYRGDLEPKTNVSEPLAFRVATRAEILEAMQKQDVRAERNLDEIIRRELGIGDSK